MIEIFFTMSEDNNIIGKIKNVAQNLPGGSHVFLYGSQARGTADSESDWDLLIILDKDTIANSDHDKYAYPFTYLGWELGKTVTPVLYSKKQWDSYSFTPFYKNVEKEKIQLL